LQDPIGYRGQRDFFARKAMEDKEDAALRAKGRQAGKTPAQIQKEIQRAKKQREAGHKRETATERQDYLRKYGGNTP
jgi:catalase (peroxidase I)